MTDTCAHNTLARSRMHGGTVNEGNSCFKQEINLLFFISLDVIFDRIREAFKPLNVLWRNVREKECKWNFLLCSLLALSVVLALLFPVFKTLPKKRKQALINIIPSLPSLSQLCT
jgi:hypothetical protein